MQTPLRVPGAETQEEADRALELVLTGAHCSWPDKPSRLFVDYVMVECLKTGLLEAADPSDESTAPAPNTTDCQEDVDDLLESYPLSDVLACIATHADFHDDEVETAESIRTIVMRRDAKNKPQA